MRYRQAAIIGTLAASVLGAAACSRDAAESKQANAEVSRDVDRAADLQRQRDEEISRLDQRVADVERKYAEANQKVVSGSRTATTGLREELKEDVTNVKKAVDDLRTTTPDNWWERQEAAMQRSFDDVESELSRDWGTARGRSSLEWDNAKHATRDAWHRLSNAVERAIPGDSDRDGR